MFRRLAPLHIDPFRERGRHILADKVWLDRQFAMTAVDQNGQLDPPGAAEIVQRIEGGSHGSSAKEHIIGQDDCAAGDVKGDLSGKDVGQAVVPQVVPVHPSAAEIEGITAYARVGQVPTDIDLAVVVVPAAAVDRVVDDCIARRIPAILNAHNADQRFPFIALRDLVGHPRQRPLHRRPAQNDGRSRHKKTGRSPTGLARLRMMLFISFDHLAGWQLKERLIGIKIVRSGGGLAAFSPFGPVLHDPIGQSLFETDIAPRLFGLDPFML